jgi:hypothetical protein
MALCRRLSFHHCTKAAVASSTGSSDRQGPWRWISSAL